MTTFVSRLGPSMSDFLDYKHALGIKYISASVYLRELDRYNAAHGDHRTLIKEVVDGWALEHAEKSTTSDRSWVSPIREFGRCLVNTGDISAYVLDNSFIIQRYRPEVYLMTENEIYCFFKECDQYVLRKKVPGRAYVFPALYRFMYCCGVRSAEARQLKCRDVHLDKSFVDILWAKAHRDRRLFLSEELTQYLINYDAAIRKVFPEREYFFPGGHGGICSSTALSANFRNIWLSAGLKRDGKVKPRAYDFRHHFACANIMRWASEGKDIHAMLPYLMRYMGHSSLESTYYYIHLIPDFFPQYRGMTASTEELIPMKYKRKKDKDFWQMARAYLHDFMPAVRNQSDKSVAAYKQSLNSYLTFLESRKGLKEDQVAFDAFSRNNVKDFVEWLREKKYAPKTINLKLTAIRSFLKYCADEDFELRGIYNDVCTVRKVKEEKKPIEYLQPEATKAILSSYDTRTAKHRRNRMILILLYDTGARVQELSDLSVSSLHLDVPNPYVTLIGKGRKTRNVPIMNKTVAHLKKYLEEFHPDLTEAPLFYSRLDGKPHQLSSDSISLILKTAANAARVNCPEVPENVHCHLIRNPNFNKIQTFYWFSA